jgi:hypothetical protein
MTKLTPTLSLARECFKIASAEPAYAVGASMTRLSWKAAKITGRALKPDAAFVGAWVTGIVTFAAAAGLAAHFWQDIVAALPDDQPTTVTISSLDLKFSGLDIRLSELNITINRKESIDYKNSSDFGNDETKSETAASGAVSKFHTRGGIIWAGRTASYGAQLNPVTTIPMPPKPPNIAQKPVAVETGKAHPGFGIFNNPGLTPNLGDIITGRKGSRLRGFGFGND